MAGETLEAKRWIFIAAGIGLAYALFYLWAIGDVNIHGPPAWGWFPAELTLERALTARSTLMFEAIGVVEMGWLVWLLSPVNLFIAVVLGALLAANVHGALYLRAQPAACRAGSRGMVGALPALFAGGACCAPSLILLLGLPGLGAVAGLFGWLVPLSIIALGASRIWQHHQGAPRLVHFVPQSLREIFVTGRRSPEHEGNQTE